MPVDVLITGAQGFVGRYTLAHWLRAHPTSRIVGIGRSRALRRSFTHRLQWAGTRPLAPLPSELRFAATDSRYRYIPLDLRSRPALIALLKEVRPSVILHLAGALRDEPSGRLFSLNVLATESLFEAIAAAGIEPPRVVLGSSGAVYGCVAEERLPIREDETPMPFDLYSVSKLSAEQTAGILSRRYHIPVVYARIFNVVGPGQDERHLCGWIARQMAELHMGLESRLSVGPLDTTRDFVDVRDVADALSLLAVRGSPGMVYNVASGRETPTEVVFQTLKELSGLDPDFPIAPRPARAADCRRVVADIARLCEAGHRPAFSLRQSLSEVLNYYAGLAATSGQVLGKSRRDDQPKLRRPRRERAGEP